MINNRLKRTVPRKLVILNPKDYKILSTLPGYIRAKARLVEINNDRTQTLTFKINYAGDYFINKQQYRRDKDGNMILYGIKA